MGKLCVAYDSFEPRFNTVSTDTYSYQTLNLVIGHLNHEAVVK